MSEVDVPRSFIPCVTCRRAFEARPGVRLCLACLGVARACFEAIRAEDAAEKEPRRG